MAKLLLVACLALGVLALPAVAGSASLTKGDSKMKLFCNNSGCFSVIYKGGRKVSNTRLGAGGDSNFRKHKARFVGQGWS